MTFLFSLDNFKNIWRWKNTQRKNITSIRHMMFFYRTQVSLGSDLWVLMSVTQWLHTILFADLTDVTLADDDSNSIPTDDVNKAILGNVAIQVAPSGGQQWNKCKWHHLVTKLVTNSRKPNCWPNLQLMHVVLSGGQNWN